MIAGVAENITEKICFEKKTHIFMLDLYVSRKQKNEEKKLEKTNCDVSKTHLNCISRVI